MSNSCFCW